MVDLLPSHWQKTLQEAGIQLAEGTAISGAKIRGTTWTRHPEGGRTMLCTWQAATGERTLQFFRQFPPRRPGLPDFRFAVDQWLRTEQALGTPVHIEWALYRGDWYITNVLPLPNQNIGVLQAYRELEATLPSQPFLWELAELAELAPHPTPLTVSLLQWCHTQEPSPITQAYQALGFTYPPTWPYRLVQGELYTDRERELQNLLPSFSLAYSENFKPRWSRAQGSLATLRNIDTTRKLDPHAHLVRLATELSALLNETLPSDLELLLAALRNNCRLGTQLDICANKALTVLQRELRGTPLSIAQLINAELDAEPAIPAPLPPRGIGGNGWNIGSSDVFFSATLTLRRQHAVTQAWQRLESGARHTIGQRLADAQTAVRLREWHRWQLARTTWAIGQSATAVIERLGISGGLAPFAHIGELLQPGIDLNTLQHRLQAWQQIPASPTPRLSHLADMPIVPVTLSLSGGSGSGQVATLADLPRISGPVILATPTLHVGILPHLSRINGIMTASGNILSHVAAIARARGIPVIIHPAATNTQFIGTVAQVNGDTAEVRQLRKAL